MNPRIPEMDERTGTYLKDSQSNHVLWVHDKQSYERPRIKFNEKKVWVEKFRMYS